MVTHPKVRPDATVDFDHHSDAFNLNELAVNAELRQRCPVAWNENYDGFWYLSSYDAVSHTARDGDTFAHKYEPNAPDGIDYQGEMGVPPPTANLPWASARSTAPTTKPSATRWPRSSPPVPSRNSNRSWSNRRTGSSTNTSQLDRWTWCSTTPARSRPS